MFTGQGDMFRWVSIHRAEVLSALDEDGDGKVDLQAGIQCPTPGMATGSLQLVIKCYKVGWLRVIKSYYTITPEGFTKGGDLSSPGESSRRLHRQECQRQLGLISPPRPSLLELDSRWDHPLPPTNWDHSFWMGHGWFWARSILVLGYPMLIHTQIIPY